jgi:hypothetical protein
MSRHTRHALSVATFPIIAALYGQHNRALAPDGDGGGAGGGAGGDDKNKGKAEPKKIELTEEELSQRINAATVDAVKKAEEKAAAAAKKKADDDAAKAAKEQGDFKKLYDGEVELKKKAEQERDEARTETRSKHVEILLGRYLAKNHKEYVDAAEWIRPHVKFAPDDDDAKIEKAIKETVDQYVKDNPRAAGSGGGGGAPSAARGGKITTSGDGNKPNERKQIETQPHKPFSNLYR